MENENTIKNEFLNKKKLRLDELIKKYKEEPEREKNKKKKSNKSASDYYDSDSDSEIENYKNIISGKINIANLTNKNKMKDLQQKEKIQSIIDEEKIHKTNQKHLINRQQALGFLPKPVNKNENKSFNRIYLGDEEEEDNFFNNIKSNLINPDNTSYSELNENRSNNITDLEPAKTKSTNVVDLNVKDLVDKNWELNYLAKLQKKDLYKTNIGEITRDHKKTNHLRSMISDYKSKKDIDEDFDLKIKSSKISTKAKYGW